MKRIFICAFAALPLFFAGQGCKEVGFRDLDDVRHRASMETARRVMEEVQVGLKKYNEVHHTYPITTEIGLYDSLRDYLGSTVDPAYLYRNDNGHGYYIAVGGRNNRMVYSYPPSIGPNDYTFYWVGPNGVNEDGEGDDLFPSADTALTRSERQLRLDVRTDGNPLSFKAIKTGGDLFKDSVFLRIVDEDTVLFHDGWPLSNYFINRPELTERERRKMVRDEFDKILTRSQFVRTDSIEQHDWRRWAEFKPKSIEANEIVKSNELMFNYYRGIDGSRGIVWSPTRKKFITVWKSSAP